MGLVEDILDLAKIDAGKFSINYKEFELSEVLKEIEFIFDYQCEKKSIKFDINKKCRTDKLVSDPNRIKQVLMNLVTNALKFTEKGRIELEVDIEREKSESYLFFKVIDTGIGIKEENLHKLFKLFGTINDHK
jgi:signal transduction histidine kinase